MKKYGALIKEKDARDYTLAKSVRAVAQWQPKFECVLQGVKDQAAVNSCVAHAFASATESLFYVDRGYSFPISAGGIYQNRKEYDYTGEGMYMFEAANRLLKDGVCLEREYPYNEPYSLKTKHALNVPLRFKIDRYIRLSGLSDIRQFMSGARCYVPIVIRALNNLRVDKNGYIKYQSNYGNAEYSHAVCVVGYDDEHINPDNSVGRVKIQNSWGTTWGEGGFAYISYSDFGYYFQEGVGLEADYRDLFIHTIGTDLVQYKGEVANLPVPTYLHNNYTMFPLRSMTEIFGDAVIWGGSENPDYCEIVRKVKEE